ncbi:MAG: ABC transporter ATP-binding protein [Meiothermus sp.]|nr:ABC transporter ATP-binding protein [Meiothermus sp.]
MAGIRVENITRTFGKSRALNGVSLEVHDQEFVVLLGPSGCGKTTLLRIVAGLDSADSGKVFIGSKDVSALPPRLRGIAMVFQNYAIFPHLTVWENIAFGLRMKREPQQKVKEQVEKAAALMHIGPYLSRLPAQLSGGQRQRVAVARALAVEPEVLLMDEPLSNLDALLRLEMRAELKKLLQEAKTTTLYVTHDQVEAMSLADRIAVMNAGNVVQYDVPVKVYQEPANTFVGGFIGNPPMNFIRAKLEGTQAQVGEVAYPVVGVSGQDKEVLMGVRPEDLEVSSEPIPGSFQATVQVFEHLGPHLLLTVLLGQQIIKATAHTELLTRPGATVWLKPNPARVRWLEVTQGQGLVRT